MAKMIEGHGYGLSNIRQAALTLIGSVALKVLFTPES